jgi:hypothetical protein
MSQEEVVNHFRTRKEGALEFSQSALSHKLKAASRKELQERAISNPTGLSAKRARITTRPDVERALYLWVLHMTEKNELVSGPMLLAKRAALEEKMGVPEEERLKGSGWLSSFKRMCVILASH